MYQGLGFQFCMPWMKSIWKKITIKHRVIQSLTEILIKNISFKKKFNKTVMIFFSVPSTGLLKGTCLIL